MPKGNRNVTRNSDQNGNSWESSEQRVNSDLDSLWEGYHELRDDMQALLLAVTALETKAVIYGMIAGAVVSWCAYKFL